MGLANLCGNGGGGLTEEAGEIAFAICGIAAYGYSMFAEDRAFYISSMGPNMFDNRYCTVSSSNNSGTITVKIGGTYRYLHGKRNFPENIQHEICEVNQGDTIPFYPEGGDVMAALVLLRQY